MPIFNTIGSAAARAYGLFKRTTSALSGSYLYLWGSNAGSQIGNYTVGGTTVDRSSPVQITNKQFSTVSLNNQRGGLAVKTDGTLWSWGTGTSGILGDGTTVTKSFPVQIGTYNGWAQVSGGINSFGVLTNGDLYAWGLNTTGALGDGTTVNKSSPVMMGSNVRYVARSGGNFNACITNDNSLYTWGVNTLGQLGDSTTVNKSAPTLIGGTANWSKVVCGMSHMVAIKTDGTAWAWGSGANYRTGQGATTNRSSPVQIGTLTNWTDVGATYAGSFIMNSSGVMYYIGVNAEGQAGMGGVASGTYGPSAIPATQIMYVDYVSLPPTSGSFSSGIRSNGTLWSWGVNTNYQLGDGTGVDQSFPVQAGVVTTWSKLSGYEAGMSGIRTDGSLWGWGLNDYGQIGNGNVSQATSPDRVGTLTNWGSIYTTKRNTFSIKTDGTLWGWGANAAGQIGNGTTTSYSSPVQVGTLTDWARLNRGSPNYFGTTFAIKNSGALWAWGGNGLAIFGNGTTVSTSSPIQIGTLTNWSRISTDGQCVLAVKTDGTLWSWGANGIGQLGNGTTIGPTSSPVQVGTLTNWSDVGVGARSQVVAIKTDGTLWGWGSEYSNFDASTVNRSSPVQLGTSSDWAEFCMGFDTQWARKTTGEVYAWGMNVSSVAAGVVYTNITALSKSNNITWSSFQSNNQSNGNGVVAKKTDGTLWAWGSNGGGQYGNGTTTPSTTPLQVRSVADFNTYAIGYQGVATINSTTNNLWISGSGIALGQGSPTGYSSPQMVGSGTTKWSSIAGIATSVIAVDTLGQLWSWGENNVGQLGIGTTNNESAPVQVGTLTDWRKLHRGLSGTASAVVAVKSNGTMWGWGASVANGNGTGTNANNSFQTPMPTSGKQVADFSFSGAQDSTYGSSGGRRAIHVIDTVGRLWAIGYNNNGLLGNSSTTDVSGTYVQIGTLTNWASVSGGNSHVMATKTDGTLWGWGYNVVGQLGDGSVTTRSSPVQIGTLTNWASVSTASSTSYAVKTDGTLWSWGQNAGGALGTGSTVASISSPVQIGTLTTWATVSGSSDSGMAIKTDGTLWGWGANSFGSLGVNNTTAYSSPVQVGTLTTWSKIKASANAIAFTAIKTDGTLWGWGYNGYGRIGDGTPTNRSSPVQVGTLTNWTDCMASQYNSYFLNSSGALYSTGTSINPGDAVQSYWLGNVTTSETSSPIQIGVYTTYTKLGRGMAGSGAIDNQGYLFAWGPNGTSPITYTVAATAESSPVQIGSQTNWAKPYIKTDGSLWLWGTQVAGNMGLNNEAPATATFAAPVRVGTLTNWSDVSFGFSHTVAIKTDGTIWAWGLGTQGQLGLSNTTTQSSPVQVGTLTWTKIRAGATHTVGLRSDSTVWCWGQNSSGQLGQGNTTSRSSPVQVSLATTAVDIDGGNGFSLATLSDGTMYAWGVNSAGQLCDGTTVNKSTPVLVSTSYTWAGNPESSGNGFTGGLSAS
jgi:alpha-tubulin suppressor-like RCC1 family protein